MGLKEQWRGDTPKLVIGPVWLTAVQLFLCCWSLPGPSVLQKQGHEPARSYHFGNNYPTSWHSDWQGYHLIRSPPLFEEMKDAMHTAHLPTPKARLGSLDSYRTPQDSSTGFLAQTLSSSFSWEFPVRFIKQQLLCSKWGLIWPVGFLFPWVCIYFPLR